MKRFGRGCGGWKIKLIYDINIFFQKNYKLKLLHITHTHNST